MRGMTTVLRLPALLCLLLLASCASMDDRSTLAPGNQGTMVNDAEYIAVVETLAARRGVQVEWVNPPKVKSSDD